ncbi:hypothetical protein [Paraglaciecola sp. MB-3u-78]|uniref:hypothetical protein n=1 Tax=Paraglaciecola sp. MB-3u-78 TaxID=2058332 RepID=UPI000C329154|nr:hypothetical protein [Paraglaciecola sp. MB-3u-78]PKH00233.1 hypothetical protein CXF95_06405 [Paraglaciecola sp. MB-3u-78]
MDSDCIQSIAAVISSIAAAFVVYFAYKTIIENRKNIFIRDKHRLAITLRDLHLKFQQDWGSFKLSNYPEEQNIILASKYIISPELYNDLMGLMVKLHQFEKSEDVDSVYKNETAEGISTLFKSVSCKQRLDE